MKRSVIAISFLLISTTAGAQVKKWVDEQGITHYEAQGTGQTREEKSQPKPKPTRHLERSHAGYTLGDHVSFVRATKKAMASPVNKNGAQILLFLPSTRPTGTDDFHLMFLNDRLAVITAAYPIYKFINWDELIKTSVTKYGEPDRSEPTRKSWLDGEVSFTISQEGERSVIIQTAFISALKIYLETIRSNAPKF